MTGLTGMFILPMSQLYFLALRHVFARGESKIINILNLIADYADYA